MIQFREKLTCIFFSDIGASLASIETNQSSKNHFIYCYSPKRLFQFVVGVTMVADPCLPYCKETTYVAQSIQIF